MSGKEGGATAQDLEKLGDRLEVIRAKTIDLELRHALLDQKTGELEKDLKGVIGSFNWAGRVFFALIIAAIMGFIFAGGFVL
jgi:hypothetical protein